MRLNSNLNNARYYGNSYGKNSASSRLKRNGYYL